MKEQIIQIPDTLEIKEIKDGKIILVEKKKKLTYEDIARKLFINKHVYWINRYGEIDESKNIANLYLPNPNNCISEKQTRKLLAINKLMNVAKYLNNGWQPDWSNYTDYKYYICYVNNYLRLAIEFNTVEQGNSIYFKSRELAKQAIDILGEETIKLALCTDY